eukprot:TRINITY_DN6394_c1_g2_i4.p1 TRINITY_DN6394_c1_g2~~TRINITY_DN6394_c1_g2_i4.p1  ORF type:complete len:347 (-),score=35.84 TRINITY_DN6394_c1_g2_i4:340-1350(-)
MFYMLIFSFFSVLVSMRNRHNESRFAMDRRSGGRGNLGSSGGLAHREGMMRQFKGNQVRGPASHPGEYPRGQHGPMDMHERQRSQVPSGQGPGFVRGPNMETVGRVEFDVKGIMDNQSSFGNQFEGRQQDALISATPFGGNPMHPYNQQANVGHKRHREEQIPPQHIDFLQSNNPDNMMNMQTRGGDGLGGMGPGPGTIPMDINKRAMMETQTAGLGVGGGGMGNPQQVGNVVNQSISPALALELLNSLQGQVGGVDMAKLSQDLLMGLQQGGGQLGAPMGGMGNQPQQMQNLQGKDTASQRVLHCYVIQFLLLVLSTCTWELLCYTLYPNYVCNR